MKDPDESGVLGGARFTALRMRAARAWAWLARHARPVLGVYWVCLVLGTHWPNLSIVAPAEDPGPLNDVLKLDKVLHAVGFGGLMVLLILAGLGGRGRPWAGRCGVALAIGLTFAVLDEWSQGLVVGRTVNASDMVTNLLAMLGVYLVAVLPSAREPGRDPRRLRWALWLSLPVLAVVALSPWVIATAIRWKVAVMGKSTSEAYRLDHIGHGVMSAVLSVVVIVVWPMASRRPRRAGAAAVAILVLAGPGLEVVQHFTGRSVEWEDALAHGIGVLLAMMWWAARLSFSKRLREPADPANPAGVVMDRPAIDPSAIHPPV